MFSSGSAQHALGRPQDRLAAASPVRAAGCRGLHVRRAWRSLFFVFTLLHACRLSGQPSFSACFPAFLDGDSKVCVCVCVCVLSIPFRSPFSGSPTHLAILTVVHPCLTRRWLGSNVGTSISPSCVLMCASAPPGLVRITFLYVTQFMELQQGLRGHFR